jgi:hypothetical protein
MQKKDNLQGSRTASESTNNLLWFCKMLSVSHRLHHRMVEQSVYNELARISKEALVV